ncbi:hypothetical protein [Deinococcus phoenicis]|nr:hypothetical protein [Deinococcus phoenicis]
MLQAPTVGQEQPVSMSSASPLTLHLWRCKRVPGCQDRQNRQEVTFPNPTLWAVIGVFVTAGAGFWRPAGQQR